MVISVGITRVVSLASYAEDGSEILNNANVLMVRLKQNDLVPWITTLNERMESRQVP